MLHGMGIEFDILHFDDDFVIIDKPEGFHVHAPEDPTIKADPSKIVLQQLRDQLGKKVYPVHRLDVPTSGCLLMALSSEAASALSKQLEEGDFEKVYTAVVRGWTEEEMDIKIPLESEDKKKELNALSYLRRLKTLEIPEAVGKKHPTARYSLVHLQPVTGRFHQLRRHMNRVSHPIIGDVSHGDNHQNHFFADRMGVAGLCLRAHFLSFTNPRDPEDRIEVEAPWPTKWEKLFELFDYEPISDII
jgi:tRNA pseudouridine65 synthase